MGGGELAVVYCYLGQLDQALDLLEEGYAHHIVRVETAVGLAYDRLHSNPRFTQLLQEFHLAN